MQQSSISLFELGKSELREETNQNWKSYHRFQNGLEMYDYNGKVFSSVVVISWEKLIPGVKPHETNVKISCNPNDGICIETIQKSVSKSGSRYSDHPTQVSGCGSGLICAQEAKAALSSAQPTQKNESSWTINFCRPEDAARGAKAINHLIELHGGKMSLF
jgi:hypothetical protein